MTLDQVDGAQVEPDDPILVLVWAYLTVMGVATEVEVLHAAGIEPTFRGAVRRRRELLRLLAAALR